MAGLGAVAVVAVLTGATGEGRAAESSRLCELHAGSEAPYPPFQLVDESGRFSGIEIDLLRAIGQEIGCTIRFTAMPWPRILRGVEAGAVDVAMNAIAKPEREVFARFSIPYLDADVRLFVRRADADLYHLKSLRELPAIPGDIGTIIGYSFGEAIDSLIATTPTLASRIVPARDYRANIRMLSRGRLTGFIGQAVTVNAALQEAGMTGEIMPLPAILDITPYRLMESRKTVPPALTARIDQAIETLRARGVIDRLVSGGP